MKQMTTLDFGTINAQFAIKHTQICGSYFIHIFFLGGEGNIKVIFEVINLHYFIQNYLFRLYKERPKSFKTSSFKRVLCVTSSGRHRNYVVLCFM